MFLKRQIVQLADDDTESVGLLFRLRLPPLIVGLFLGMILSFSVSRLEEVIATNVSVAFFIPFVVYLAAAVGAQTQAIYVRELRSGKSSFKGYFAKECALGVCFGIIFAVITGVLVNLWFGDIQLSKAVALSVLGAVGVAPVVALVVTELLELEHTDPAVGAGPIATVIQDTISVLVYGFITTAILLN